MFNKFVVNSAFSGLDESLSMTGQFRKQWMGFPATPLHFNFNAHMPLIFLKSGVGLGFEYDQLGAAENLRINAAYNYIFDFKDLGQLSCGISIAFLQRSIDGSLILTPEGFYENGVNHNDPLLPVSKTSAQSLALDFSLYYKHRFFEFGISGIQLNEPVAQFTNAFNYTDRRNFFIFAQGNIRLNESFILQPVYLLKTDLNKFQNECSLILEWNEFLSAGLSFRGFETYSVDALSIMAAVRINQHLRVAYAYDISLGSLQNYNSGSHELILNYNLRKEIGHKIPEKVIWNPRFL